MGWLRESLESVFLKENFSVVHQRVKFTWQFLKFFLLVVGKKREIMILIESIPCGSGILVQAI